MNPDLNPSPAPAEPARRALAMKCIGVGGAGGNAVEYLAQAGFTGVEFIALNTDLQALDNCRTAIKCRLGGRLTHGMGAGGDPDQGRQAAEQDAARIRGFCQGVDLVFIVAGMGGGTGTGAGPVVARIARECGALTLAFAIMPFAFENPRRQKQARLGLQHFKDEADGVICLANERLATLIDEKTGLLEAFRFSHEWLGQGLRGIWRLLTKPGLINVDFAHLRTVLRDRHGESAFVTVEASGPNRAREIVDRITTSPMLEAGKQLDEAASVLISIAGGAELSMAEVNRLMEPFNHRCANADVVMGAMIDPALQDRLEVTVIATRRLTTVEEAEKMTDRLLQEALLPAQTDNSLGTHMRGCAEPPPPPPRYMPPPPELTSEQKERFMDRKTGIPAPLRRVLPRLRQGQLPLDVISKGRFEKSQPTIHEGVDLDLPTFKRRGTVLN
jgi:cell division protein FtsZ